MSQERLGLQAHRDQRVNLAAWGNKVSRVTQELQVQWGRKGRRVKTEQTVMTVNLV